MVHFRPEYLVHFTPVQVVHIAPESLVHFAPVEVVHYTPVCSVDRFVFDSVDNQFVQCAVDHSGGFGHEGLWVKGEIFQAS